MDEDQKDSRKRFVKWNAENNADIYLARKIGAEAFKKKKREEQDQRIADLQEAVLEKELKNKEKEFRGFEEMKPYLTTLDAWLVDQQDKEIKEKSQIIQALLRDRIEAERKKKLSRIGNSRGGKKRTASQQERYDIHKDWWDKWNNNQKLFKNKTAYDEAMIDKTGASLATVRRHRTEFSETNHE